MDIRIKRVHDEPAFNDGYRVLIDRVWPRGIGKQALRLDAWMKTLAPSTGLRKWFNHEPPKWDSFRQAYFDELGQCPEAVDELLARVRQGRVTLVFAARDREHNNAVALKDYLKQRLAG